MLARLKHAGAVRLMTEGVTSAGRLKAGAGAFAAIFTCITVRVLGP